MPTVLIPRLVRSRGVTLCVARHLFPAVALYLVACDVDKPTAPQLAKRALLSTGKIAAPVRRKLYDEEMLDLAQRVPGFAGYVLNERGPPVSG